MKIKVFSDGADLPKMKEQLQHEKQVCGFTTNPTLMRQSGIQDYESFAKEVIAAIPTLPVCFEVLSDSLEEMEQQARKIASWSPNIYVKIPVTNTKRISTAPILKNLSEEGVKLNVTAVFTNKQVEEIVRSLSHSTPSIVSIFAGRIANAGIDPVPIVKNAVECAKSLPACEILWASPREIFNVMQAESCGCHIITLTAGLLAALKTFGKDLEEYSLETVKMFYDDAQLAGYHV